MPVWAVAPFFGACSTRTQLELPFWAIWFRRLFPQCFLCFVAFFISTLALAGVSVLFWCFVRIVCVVWVVCVAFPCLARLLLLLPLGSFATQLLRCFVLLLFLCGPLCSINSCLRLYYSLCCSSFCLRLSLSLGVFVPLPALVRELA